MITGFRTEPTQDVDAMWEADAAAEWERLNAPDPDDGKLTDAAYYMGYGKDKIEEALDELATAAKRAEGTVAYDRIVSLIDALDDLSSEIHILKIKLEEGKI